MPSLKNHSHEQFAQKIATGLDKAAAYRSVYPNAKPSSSCSAGTRLFKIVQERVNELQRGSATKNTLTMQERREFLARCVRADLNALDLEKDGDLIQEKITTITPQGQETVKVKLPGKRECIMSDAELSGELVSHHDLTSNGSPLAAPVVQLITPPTFHARRGAVNSSN